MKYTEADLQLAERGVVALEKFIAEQKERFAATEWDSEHRAQLDRLLREFEQALEVQRRRCREIRLALAAAD